MRPAAALTCARGQMAEAFGAKGWVARTPEEVRAALASAAEVTDLPTVVNVLIDPEASRKPQEFDWLTRSKL